MRGIFGRAAVAPPTLDVYDIAYLAGGPRRVAESALIGLHERGVVKVRGSRVTAGQGQPEHAVERVLTGLELRGQSVGAVIAAVLASGEVREIGRWLAAQRLLARSRRRPTGKGAACLTRARAEGETPGYVLDGVGAIKDRRLFLALVNATPPSGLDRFRGRRGSSETGDLRGRRHRPRGGGGDHSSAALIAFSLGSDSGGFGGGDGGGGGGGDGGGGGC